MEKEQKVEVTKSDSPKVTNEVRFKEIRGDLLQYNEDLTVKGYDKPKITLVVSEDLEKHQNGIVRLIVQRPEGRESYLVHMDGILSCVYASYAKNINALRKPTIRQRVVRMKGFFSKLKDRLVSTHN